MGKVLVVDDKYYIRQLMLTALRLKGYDVMVAGDGREGLILASSERPAVILLDLLMPGVDGYDMLEELRHREETKDIPVIVMSAEGDHQGMSPVSGVQGFLLKPFDLEVMESLVEKFVSPVPGHRTRNGLAEEEIAAGED